MWILLLYVSFGRGEFVTPVFESKETCETALHAFQEQAIKKWYMSGYDSSAMIGMCVKQ